MVKNDIAIFSSCGLYRFLLTRKLSDGPYKPILFIMLNPSTADAVNNDPTIRRCIGFAKREKCTDLSIVNLYPIVSSNPAMLKYYSSTHFSEAFENKEYVQKELEAHTYTGMVIAAWGAYPVDKEHVAAVLGVPSFPIYCLGKTKSGAPRHPLYVPSAKPLEIYYAPSHIFKQA